MMITSRTAYHWIIKSPLGYMGSYDRYRKQPHQARKYLNENLAAKALAAKLAAAINRYEFYVNSARARENDILDCQADVDRIRQCTVVKLTTTTISEVTDP